MKTKHKGIIIPDYFIAMKWIAKHGKCMSDLQRELNITYKHLHELKHTFIELKWITIQKEERKHIMHLTDYGREVEAIIDNFLKVMNIYEQDILKYIEEGKIKKTVPIDIEQLKRDTFE